MYRLAVSYFFLTVKFISLFQASTEVFSYWDVQTLEDFHFTSIDLEPDVQCNIHILMHQMRISTTYVSSVMLRSKNWNLKYYDNKYPKKSKQSAVKWNQIRRRIELCMREMILCFEMNLFDSYIYLVTTDPTFAFVGGPCWLTHDFVIAICIMITFDTS
jgi:hypothetical protein